MLHTDRYFTLHLSLFFLFDTAVCLHLTVFYFRVPAIYPSLFKLRTSLVLLVQFQLSNECNHRRAPKGEAFLRNVPFQFQKQRPSWTECCSSFVLRALFSSFTWQNQPSQISFFCLLHPVREVFGLEGLIISPTNKLLISFFLFKHRGKGL
jgi:hypothetical protein